jgi:hypothetical protein
VTTQRAGDPWERREGHDVLERDERRAELLAGAERARARLLDAAPGSPEWDAARTELDELQWKLTSLEGPGPDEESL